MDQNYWWEWGGQFVVDQTSIDPVLTVAWNDREGSRIRDNIELDNSVALTPGSCLSFEAPNAPTPPTKLSECSSDVAYTVMI